MTTETPSRCEGTFARRSFLRAGLAGWSSLGLADLLRSLALASPAGQGREKSIIMLWLWGGPSHLETFDLKPEAPSEYRGEFRPIKTNVPGIEICEHLPKIAKLADKFSLIRSLHHDSPGHVNSTHSLLTGYPGELVETPPYLPKYPYFSSVVHKVKGSRRPDVPCHVVMPTEMYFGTGHLPGSLKPLAVGADPNTPGFAVPNLSVEANKQATLQERVSLLKGLDQFPREVESSGLAGSMDKFQTQALSLLTSNRAREAFDISREHPRLRERYGRNLIGQRCLLARRLVEAGVRLVTVDFPYFPGGKAFSWDDHASVWNIFTEMKHRLPILDQVVSALIEDLADRGLSDDVLLIVMGEMSHTPRLSYVNGQPGRDHWGQAMCSFLSGGGLRMGQVIGSTNSKGEEPRERAITPADFLSTLYRYIGVPTDLQFNDSFGRPIPLLPNARPIHELFS